MSLSEIADEVGGEGDFQLITDERLEEIRNSSFRDEPDYSDPLTVEQAKRFSEAVRDERGYGVAPAQFEDDDEFFGILNRIEQEWPSVNLLFGGSLDEYGYINTIYVVYDGVDDSEAFREYCVVHFKVEMSKDADENAGVCPFCDDRITLSRDTYRETDNDDNLWMTAHEFDFREYPEHGRTLRMWFDE